MVNILSILPNGQLWLLFETLGWGNWLEIAEVVLICVRCLAKDHIQLLYVSDWASGRRASLQLNQNPVPFHCAPYHKVADS